MTRTICLNADIGEMSGDAGRALDRAILDVVSRCSIACGGHAGDEASMEATLAMARDRGVKAGAHPSYPDREGFGRSRNNISTADLKLSLKAQTASLLAIAARTGSDISHLKPHGALYNDAAKDAELAQLVAGLCADMGIPALIGPPGSEMERAARDARISFIAEGFADRAYEPDLSLTPRSMPGAVFEDHDTQFAQALSIVLDQTVTTRTGEIVGLKIGTLCLHGDTPGAASNAALLRAGLEQRGIIIRA